MLNREVSKFIVVTALLGLSNVSLAASTGASTPLNTTILVNDWMIEASQDTFVGTLDFNATEASTKETSDRDDKALQNGDERFTGSQIFKGRRVATNMDAMNVLSLTWDMQINADPFIDGNITLQNLTGSTQTYNLSFAIPVTPIFTDGVESGFLGIKIEDTGGGDNQATASLAWNGFISPDGINILNTYSIALADPIQCSAGSPGCTGGTTDFLGTTVIPIIGPTENHIGQVQFIGIQMELTLSAGDTATIVSRYEVNPVPVPAAVWLFGSSLLALVGLSKKQ